MSEFSSNRLPPSIRWARALEHRQRATGGASPQRPRTWLDGPEPDELPVGLPIPDELIERLRSAGLHTGDRPLFDENHLYYPFGYRVSDRSGDGRRESLTFFRDGPAWVVECLEYLPGPGPGDFEHRWTNGVDAADDIVDFFLG